ncbi:MAG: aldehyde dehydrogenase family protein [Donghicola eburneus]|jgi:acyl-CoA reductase-like NAD-dependent aldehyde dehydrogenase|nr:aldehyde dehydrogenase family protein [Donghicola eburneus]MCI5043034.1 aldehyde dehydrogenase family protein [Donghicola eburneus]
MLDWLKKKSENEKSEAPLRDMFIAGEWRAAKTGKSFATTDPNTGRTIALVPDAGQKDLDDAITAAADAQPAWAALPPAARAALFYRASALFQERQQDFAQMLISETGSGFGKAMFECSLVPLALAEAAGLTTREIGEIYPSQVPGKINRTMRAAAGVVGVISPWNFPLYLSLRGFVYALALGNTAVLKPSEDSPLSGGLMLAELFHDAGFPAGVFNVVTTSRDGAAMAGDVFVKDKRIAVMSFTGSTRVGQLLSTACAQAFKPIVLELGGKNPMIILDDADLDRAVDLAFFGSYLHQGQICMSCDKILVHNSLYDAFVEKLVAKTVNFVPTSPDEQTCVIGPIINDRQLSRIEQMVDDAVAAGATAKCGGKAQAPYYTATVLTDVTPDMAVWRDEIFGPVTTVTPFDSVDDAIAMANDTPYGLSASVISGDVMRGELVAEQLHAGMVHVNDSTVHDEPHCPFSGLGASGGGGKWGPKGAIEAFTTQRWISTQRQAHALPF